MKLPISISMSDGAADRPSSPMDITCSKLSQNALTELKLGYDINGIRSKRDVAVLLKVIKEKFLPHVAQDKFTCLESIRVGWRLDRFALGPVLQEVVPLLLEQKKPVWIRHLQLDLDSWVPEGVIRNLVSKNTLQSLDIRSTRIRRRSISDTRHNRGVDSNIGVGNNRRSGSSSSIKSSSSRSASSSISPLQDDNIVTILHHISPTVVTLKLVDCNLHNHDLETLCDWAGSRTLQTLSVRHNRRLDPDFKLWKRLLGLRGLQALDVSLCDLGAVDGDFLSKALIDQNPSSSSLLSLSVAANYRMGPAIPELVEAASKTLVKLDCSFCDCQNQHLKAVFDYLSSEPYSTLQILAMQGSRINEGIGSALAECILHNKSLRSLRLNHPKGRTGEYILDVTCMLVVSRYCSFY